MQAFTLDGWEGTGRARRKAECTDFGVLPRGSSCKELQKGRTKKERCVNYTSPRGWAKLYKRISGRPGFAPKAKFLRVRTPEQVRTAIRAAAGYGIYNDYDADERRAACGPLEGERTMAKKRKSAKVCTSKSTGKRVSCKRQRAGRKAARARKRSR